MTFNQSQGEVMKNFLLTLKYDGTNYCGWQVQKNGESVQARVCDALLKSLGNAKNVTGCSRTDSGVHANMYCCHFLSDTRLEAQRIVMALNAHLPLDIAAVDCKPVPDDFHARYSCAGKNYIYKIHNSRMRDPFDYKYSLLYPRRLDIDLLNEAAAEFIGEYDFTAFSATGGSTKTTVRKITESKFFKDGDTVTYSITGNGFLYNMVRIIVGTLLSVNEGKISPSDIHKILESKDRSLAGATAKPHALFLNKVYYKNGEF